MSKKVLIITYYWPPSGGPGVQRVLKFVKYLPEFGWDPIVFTVANGEYPAIDYSLEKEVANRKVYKSRTIEPYQVFRFFTGKKKGDKIETYELLKNRENLSWRERISQYLRINLLVPDARLGWSYMGLHSALRLVQQEQPALIFSSSPPHSLQLLAHKICKRTALPWVADFRDPWTQSFYDKGLQKSKWAERRNKKMEAKAVAGADVITSVSQGVLDLLPTAQRKTAVIPNGFDEADFRIAKKRHSRFTIVYTGHVAKTQNPENFWLAISKLTPEKKQNLSIHFYGSVDPVVKQSIVSFGLQEIITFHGYVDHSAAVTQMVHADLLLLLIPRLHSKGILTGKLFEYLASGNPILGIGDSSGAAAQVIKECKAGVMLDFDDDPGPFIRELIVAKDQGDHFNSDEMAVSRYSRRRLTEQLAKTFDALCR